ncbi:recombinase family protein [Streptomyces sp. NPDC059349]|uniref:recombinase family protein n=1 Tax=Streptomyces sp. NPDC059349 TaxID=3346808 RepID=UPI003698B86C
MRPAEKVILYARVSHIKRGPSAMNLDTRSIDQQLTSLRGVANTQRWHVLAELKDSDCSASRFAVKDREEFLVLKRLVREGRATLIAAWEVSRFERVTSDWLELLDACAEAGIRLWYSGRVIDPSNPEDRWAATVDGENAEKEAAHTSDRAQRGISGAAEQGRPHGRPPYGLTKGAPDGHNRPTWVVDTEQVTEAGDTPAMIVREVVTRIALGESISRIKADLDARGVPAPGGRDKATGDWSRQSIRDMASNAAYIGRVERRVGYELPTGETRMVVSRARWPCLIDEEKFHAARERLRSRQVGHRAEVKYVLSRFATCGECGESVRGMRNVHKKRGNYVHEVYVCHRHHVSRSVQQLDRYITTLLLFRLARPDIRELLKCVDAGLREAIAQRDEAEQKIEEWQRAAEDGCIGPREYNRFTRRWSEQRLRAEQVIANSAAASEGAVLLSSEVPHNWPDLAIPHRRAILKAAFSKIIIEPQATNRFDPRHISVQWRGSGEVLHGGSIVTSSGMQVPELQDANWTEEQRRRIGWVEPRYAWADGWRNIALHTAWGDLL